MQPGVWRIDAGGGISELNCLLGLLCATVKTVSRNPVMMWLGKDQCSSMIDQLPSCDYNMIWSLWKNIVRTSRYWN